MNKYQKALSCIIEVIEMDKGCAGIFFKYNGEIFESIDVLKELADKFTPKKPNYEADGYSNGELVYDTWICPNCDNHYEVDYDKYDYCPNCGQALDWSDEE